MSQRGKPGSGQVLRLRNLAMIERIRRAEDPAATELIERQQVVARLGRMFRDRDDPNGAMRAYARELQTELGRPARGRRSGS